MARSYAACEDYGGPPPSVSDLPLFAPPEVRKLARRSDPDTSREAAVRIFDGLSELQQRVLTAFQTHGRLTAKEVEALAEFKDEHGEPLFGFSTLRKRCSEGLRDGWLRRTGVTRDGSDELEAVK